MDSTRFDALTRSLATAANRRAFLRTAFGMLAAGIAGALGQASVLADECKRDGKLCKKHDQCCSGLCAPEPSATSTSKSESVCCTPESNESTCDGRCGGVSNNCGQSVECGPCCIPEDKSVTCAGNCEQTVLNNCGESVECGLCADGMCVVDAECNSDICCQGGCCAEDISPTAACCETTCCECFEDNSPGGSGRLFCCPDSREICGTYPQDSCCLPADTCVAGECVPKVLACPPEGLVGEPNVACASGCCGATDTSPGVCCPADRPDCVQGVCVATQVCADQSQCLDGSICTAFEGNPGECCPSNRYYEVDTNDRLVPQCCFAGREVRGCDEDYCTPLEYSGCSATFRGSQPRVG